MKIKQLYTGCLAEAAYYIESNGEAVIIDPLRDVDPYLKMLEENGATLKYVLETHFHADFVSGHLDLARKTSAEIIYGPTARPNFDAYVAWDQELLKLGEVSIKVLHTPGHTMESTSYLLLDKNGNEHALFTGDTLFIGDVGRPDLAVSTKVTQEDLAGCLFDSLRNKIMVLPDEVVIYPGHGAGSACGKNMSNKTFDTLGNQKLHNYALRADMTREEFIKEVTQGLVTPPQYFPKNAVMNRLGYEEIDAVLRRGVVGLDPAAFEEFVERGEAMVLDTRPADDFIRSHIPGSIWIGLDGNFAPWVGALITDLQQQIVFLAEEGREEEVVIRLSRVGYNMAMGYLEGGIKAWKSYKGETTSVNSIGAHDFVGKYDTTFLDVLDVRKKSEFESQHVKDVQSFPLDFIHDRIESLDKHKKYYVHCQGGYRSLIACSILMSHGFEVMNIDGGFGEIKKSCVKVTRFREQETML